ncbi:mating-type switching protein swi10 [Ophiocordyceps sinensis CO18]|uniref:Mating-type switching protein swi10 n=1 Tax=Ophiocordyceps sinensis (strain Co18 / CGMCC 3.14243) TaxID=911162 RepID=T5AF33_OPHSC|nr:mating-type switching protein swi10 [Ophiocordyceps sinensis CO18]
MDDDYGADESLLAAMAAAADAPRSRPPASAAAHPAATTTTIRQPVPQKRVAPRSQGGRRRCATVTAACLGSSSPGGDDDDDPTACTAKDAATRQGTSQRVSREQGRRAAGAAGSAQEAVWNDDSRLSTSMPWEYSDIPADYVLGVTTCALFLSLKYHRLHPEYIYTRIQNLQGKYNLRVLLTMVDIPNHEDSLRELSKTSMVNNATIILCWSAAEAARYIELYKSYARWCWGGRGRSLNKSDAVALVANFGSLKNAVNAEPEQLGMLNGWGGVKVKKWCAAIDEPFRAKKAAKRGLQQSGDGDQGDATSSRVAGEGASRLEQAVPLSRVPLRDMPSASVPADQETRDGAALKQFQFLDDDDGEDDEAGLRAAGMEEPVSGSIAAALAKLRENG